MLLTVLSSLTSVGTFAFIYYNGSRKRWSWLISLGIQPLWFSITALTGAWGLLPLNIAMTYLAVRGWIKWGKT